MISCATRMCLSSSSGREGHQRPNHQVLKQQDGHKGVETPAPASGIVLHSSDFCYRELLTDSTLRRLPAPLDQRRLSSFFLILIFPAFLQQKYQARRRYPRLPAFHLSSQVYCIGSKKVSVLDFILDGVISIDNWERERESRERLHLSSSDTPHIDVSGHHFFLSSLTPLGKGRLILLEREALSVSGNGG